jgi:hypothetical protein
MTTEVDVETQARNLGWSPKEQFKGKPENWVDAETYVNRGEQIMPILRRNNEKLTGELNGTKGELAKLQAALAASQTAIEELKNFNSAMARDRAKDTKKELIDGITEARTAGDVAREVQLQDQLNETNAAIREAEKKPEVVTPPTPPVDPGLAAAKAAFDSWKSDNPWYESDPIKQSIADGFAKKLRKDGNELTGRAFFDEVGKQVEAYTASTRRPPDRVEGGGRGTGTGGGASPAGQSYADLPPEAKAACEKCVSRGDISVGKGRTFENIEAWRTHYATQYFSFG